MTRVRAAALGVCLSLGPACAALSQNSNTSGNSSGQSGNSSGQSANSSAQSNASSQQSSGSSGQSSANSRNSQTSVQSTGATTNASSDAPSSSIVAGSALLLGVAGGILTTVYTVHHRHEARLKREQMKALQDAQQPQPMPYKVEPIPLPPPPPTPPAEPPPPPKPPKRPRASVTDDPPTLDAMMMARAWLLANELQLRADLALGAGPTIDDLAGIAGIEPAHRAHFGQVLQKNRARLLVTHEVTAAQAAEVMSRVGDLVMADPILRTDGGAALASY